MHRGAGRRFVSSLLAAVVHLVCQRTVCEAPTETDSPAEIDEARVTLHGKRTETGRPRRQGATRAACCLTGLATIALALGSPAPPTAEELVRRAQRLWHEERDVRGAMAAFDEAVAAYPESVYAHFHRGGFLFSILGAVSPEDREQVRLAAQAEFDWLDRNAGDSIAAGVARDLERQISGEVWFTEKEVACPAGTVEAMGEAERLFATSQFEASFEFYRKAAELCPSSGAILTSYADAVYALGEYELAARLFRNAIEVDPWRRAAHRYLADTEARLGHPEAALRACVAAIVSDPTYEAAWSALHGFAEPAGRVWRRVRAEKTRVTAETGTDGRPKVTVSLPDFGSETSRPTTAEQVELTAWMMYGLTKAGVLGGTLDREGKERPKEAGDGPDLPETRLALERVATRSGLATLPKPRRQASPSFWDNLRRADQAGLLDAAIFLSMMDRELAAEYPAFRDAHGDELTRFVEQVLVPKEVE